MSHAGLPGGPPGNLAAKALDEAMAKPLPAGDAPLAPHDEPGFPPEPPMPGDADPFVDGPPADLMPPMEPTKLSLLDRCAAEPANDIGNGRRLRHLFGADLMSVQRIGYYVWSETHWQEDIEGAVTRPLTHEVVAFLALEHFRIMPTPQEAAAMEAGEQAAKDIEAMGVGSKPTPEQEAMVDALEAVVALGLEARKAWQGRKTARRRFATTAGNSGKLDGMLKEAAPYLSRPVGALDANPLDFNCRNGTVRLAQVDVAELGDANPDAPAEGRVGIASIRPHDRRDMIAKLAPVWWCPQSPAPRFHALLETILPHRPVRDFLQRYFGYALTALVREQVFVILHGEGRNGKSTLVDIICKVMGDYATTVPIATLVGEEKRKGAEATPDLVRLPGARLVRTAEPKEGLPLDESLIKALTGGEPILVRRLNQEFVEVYPSFKLVISCNRKPVIKGNDDGIWRRVLMVPFDVQIPENEVDRDLPQKLEAERAGILDWLIEGAKAYLTIGLQPPDEVTSATREYRDESDIIGSFVRGALEVTRDHADAIEAGTLYHVYVRWCERNSQTPFQQNTFNRRMPSAAEKAGIVRVKSSVMTYQGVRVRAGFEASSPSRTHYD